ncbi:4-alpha-glucanotransferase [Bacteroidota bacterium]
MIKTPTGDKWQRIGIQRRSGVAVPLFSVYSSRSIGIGEFRDIKYLTRWCKETGMSILQFLPMNDVGDDFAPYNAVSSFALEPMYIAINKLKNVNLSPFKKEIRKLKKLYKFESNRINYKIKKEKIDLLWKIYNRSYINRINKFEKFKSENLYWLKDYALYKVIKEKQSNKKWEEWEYTYKTKNEESLKEFEKSNLKRIYFFYWVQWQLFEQFKLIKEYAQKKDLLLMGDLPFLVARDSSDVWANQKYFKLHLFSGAPPDMYFAMGQRWGMPPYNWDEIKKDKYIYIICRLKYAENFYDMYRIDHFVGLFRIWIIETKSPEDKAGLLGNFDPQEEDSWEEHGKKILDIMIQNSEMLPCAEDLGTVPACSNKILEEYGIPGINVQRWVKERNNNYTFLNPNEYRINSVATISTHDSSTIVEWWYNEAGTIDERLFKRLCLEKDVSENDTHETINSLFDLSNSKQGRLLWKTEIENVNILLNILDMNIEKGYEFVKLYLESYNEKKKFWNFINIIKNYSNKISADFIYKVLIKINQTTSIFSIQLLQEWLSLEESFLRKNEETSYRINFPGIVDDKNWTTVLPYSLEELQELKINSLIKDINKECNRLC